MDAVIITENPIVGKKTKEVYRDIKDVKIMGYEFIIDVGQERPLIVFVNNNTHVHFYNKYLNQ